MMYQRRSARTPSLRRIRKRRSTAMSHAIANGSHESGHDPVDVMMMRRAIHLAQQAAVEGEVPVGAIVYRDREIIAEAANNRERTSDPAGHAEIIALRAAGEKLGAWRLGECSLAVTLEPCPMCAGAMVNARLLRCVFGASDPKAGACRSLYNIPNDPRLNHKVDLVGGVLEKQCSQLLRSFFRERRIRKR